ncbi:unnamed protein product [Allacma fusca]|uniref:Uncharacterized protein n=1 Tax=Allacma fusca TaxID=39272 RepID=A0A8J2PAK2_9HEXA|nr:unnamed protein product [Allacma fusca]
MQKNFDFKNKVSKKGLSRTSKDINPTKGYVMGGFLPEDLFP